jgi:hypothetical protein
MIPRDCLLSTLPYRHLTIKAVTREAVPIATSGAGPSGY